MLQARGRVHSDLSIVHHSVYTHTHKHAHTHIHTYEQIRIKEIICYFFVTLCNVRNLPPTNSLEIAFAFLRGSKLFFIVAEEKETAVWVKIDIVSHISTQTQQK